MLLTNIFLPFHNVFKGHFLTEVVKPQAFSVKGQIELGYNGLDKLLFMHAIHTFNFV